MNLRKALQWLIALACTAAAVLNILYLTGAQPGRGAGDGGHLL